MNKWKESYGSVRSAFTYFILSDLSKGRTRAEPLAEKWGSNRQNISRKCSELKELGLIKDGEFTEDGKYFHITEKGEDVLEILRDIRRNRERLEGVIEYEF